MQAGAGTNRVRMRAILTGLAGVAACLGVCAIAGPLGSLLAMVGCGVFLGILVPAYFASAQTLAGPGAAARWFGVQNFVANIAGISAPVTSTFEAAHGGVSAYRPSTARNNSTESSLSIALCAIGRLTFNTLTRRSNQNPGVPKYVEP
jgi:MFS family permease